MHQSSKHTSDRPGSSRKTGATAGYKIGRQGQNDGGTGKPSTVAIGGIGFHVLVNDLKSIPYFEMGLRGGKYSDNVHWNYRILELINTEVKQLQCIADLYEVLRAQPKYAKIKEPNWKADDRPIDIIYWLLRRLGTLAKGNEWTVDTWKDKGKTRYRFVVYKNYNNYDVGNNKVFLATNFLPVLKKKDEMLHDLVVDTIAFVSRMNKIPLWDEDGDFSSALTFLKKRVNKRSSGVLKDQLNEYCRGEAYQYLQLFKTRAKVVTGAELKRRIAKYPAGSLRKQYLLWNLKYGVKMAETRGTIKDYGYVPEFVSNKVNVIDAYRMYKIVWNTAADDIIHIKADELCDDANGFGYFYPMAFSIAKPGEVLVPLKASRFPIMLYKFMNWMDCHFNGTYRDYYHGARKKIKVPRIDSGLLLLDNIERADLRNEIRNS